MKTQFNTQFMQARQGVVTAAMQAVAAAEQMPAEIVREKVAAGRVVICANPAHQNLRFIGVGERCTVKVNANLGNSALTGCSSGELAKLKAALAAGADMVMDLSTGADSDAIRQKIIAASPVPVGTVPIYEAVARIDDAMDLTPELLLGVIEHQAQQGVDFMTIHAGLLRSHLPAADRRLLGIVSRGGALLAAWMKTHGKENPLYTHFDQVLAVCRAHDVTISLGDGLRPGCLADASDEAQFGELEALGGLVRRCREAGVQVMVEGPGHVPVDQIQMNMEKQAELCDGAPFYILGPVVCDCAPGYDHITAAIGGTLGAFHGAALLCYVTPKEHLGLPNVKDVHDGVIAFKIAAHAADVALHRPGARQRDDAISRARAAFDWEKQFELALDPERARELRAEAIRESGTKEAHGQGPDGEHFCTMCGPKFCAMRVSQAAKKLGNADGRK